MRYYNRLSINAIASTCLIVSSAVSAVQQLQIVPANPPICDGISNTGTGGMFGYSISLSSGDDPSGYTWMAIGKPWDSTVHIYVAKNPDITELLRNLTASASASATATASSTRPTQTTTATATAGPTIAQNLISGGQWTAVNQFGDVNNGTYPQRGFTLFGYSVALSQDGAWLAVGVPGRSYIPLSTSTPLDRNPYSGAVRIYRRQDTSANAISPSAQYRFVGEIANPNPMPKFWDKFGSKVLFRQSKVAGRTFLFVTSPGGWDGATVRFDEAPPTSPQWPIGPTTDVSRAGTYIYQLNSPSQVSYQPGPVVSTGSALTFIQFIRQRSSVPLGSMGIDLDALDVSASQFTLLVRDFVIPPTVMTYQQQIVSCPTSNCSFITYKGQTYNASGVVIEYRFDKPSGSFSQSGEVMTGHGFPVNDYLPSPIVQPDTPQWSVNDWFGLGISLAADPKYKRHMAVVGAPKSSMGVYTFYADGDDDTKNVQWSEGQFIVNEYQYRQSFFGQNNLFSRDGRFLIVADPAGSAMAKGHGEVFLYHRRSGVEQLYPPEFNDVPLKPVPSTAQSPFFFDRMAQFSKSSQPINNYSTFQADHFGVGMAINRYFVVIGAPVEQCMYTYTLPLSIELPDSGTVPTGPGNYTIIPEPTGNTTVINIQTIASSKAWLYGLIGGGVAVLLIIPTVMWILKRRHKQKLLRQLEAKDAAHRVSDSEVTLNAAASEPNLKGSPSKDQLRPKWR